MEPPSTLRRRSALIAGATAGTVALSGCLFGIGGRAGANEELTIENDSTRSVVLAITVSLNEPAGSQDMETVYDDTVSVPGGETRVFEVLGDHQYEVTVSTGEQTISFWTRPICSAAHTIVVVDESGTLHSDVEDCE